jgi:hypothetical protein
MASGLAVAGHGGGKEVLRWATGKTIVRPQVAAWQGAEKESGVEVTKSCIRLVCLAQLGLGRGCELLGCGERLLS